MEVDMYLALVSCFSRVNTAICPPSPYACSSGLPAERECWHGKGVTAPAHSADPDTSQSWSLGSLSWKWLGVVFRGASCASATPLTCRSSWCLTFRLHPCMFASLFTSATQHVYVFAPRFYLGMSVWCRWSANHSKQKHIKDPLQWILCF